MPPKRRRKNVSPSENPKERKENSMSDDTHPRNSSKRLENGDEDERTSRTPDKGKARPVSSNPDGSHPGKASKWPKMIFTKKAKDFCKKRFVSRKVFITSHKIYTYTC